MTGQQRAAINSRFVIVTHEFAPFRGGVATYCAELAAALQRAGATVEVWTSDYATGQHRDDFAFPVVRLRAGSSLAWRDRLAFAWQIRNRRRQLETATVLLASIGAHMTFMMPWLSGPVRCGGLWSLLHGSEVLVFERNPVWRILSRRFFPGVQRVLTVSNFSKTLIEQSFLSLWTGPITIAPCACSAAAATTTAGQPRRDGKLRILTLARVHPRKGQLDTARALARLPGDLRRNIVYQIGGVGRTRYLRQVESVCARAGVPFEYLGEIAPDSLAAVYQQCDIYALTSRSLPRSVEGFGITYLEAGFHGKPVVGYDSGGVAEAVLNGETGLLVEEGNLEALAEAFARLLSDPALRQRLGEGGRGQTARFHWDATARILLGSGPGYPGFGYPP